MGVASVITPVGNRVRDYIGAYQIKDNSIESILFVVVSKYTTEVYQDLEKVAEAMREYGADERQITKVRMMMQVSGFRELLEMDERIQQVDLQRYVQNALDETGFHAKQVIELTSAIVKSLGITAMRDYRRMLNEGNETAGYVIPLSLYETELKRFENKFQEKAPEKTDPAEITRIEVLAKAGIPRAKYYLGKILLSHDDFEKDAPLGLAYLEEAAADGDPLAAGALGDYYYALKDSDSWSRAYNYYTGFGSMALNSSRRQKIVNILNTANTNRKTIVGGVIMLLLLLATVIIAPAQNLFEPYRGWGYVFLALDAVILAIAILHHRAKPYDSLTWVPCALFVTWSLYILIRVLL